MLSKYIFQIRIEKCWRKGLQISIDNKRNSPASEKKITWGLMRMPKNKPNHIIQ